MIISGSWKDIGRTLEGHWTDGGTKIQRKDSKLKIMTSKALLRKRLSIALGMQVKPADFSWFFKTFCEEMNRPDLRTVKELSFEDVEAFSQFCGYELKYPIPLPILVQI